MEFGSLLADKFNKETEKLIVEKKKINEQALFEALCNAFKDVGNGHTVNKKGDLIRCEVIHGRKSFVDFSEINGSSFWFKADQGLTVRCELADLLLIVVNNKEIRVCCLQNKYEKNKYFMKDYDSFQVDMRQFYLLNKRPEYYIRNISNDFLKSAICPSVGSYGVFYPEKQRYNMNYFSAGILKEKYNDSIGRKRRVSKSDDVEKNVKYTHNSITVEEQQYAENLSVFGDALMDMRIGTPYPLNFKIRDKCIWEAIQKVTNIKIIEGKKIESFELENNNNYIDLSYRAAVVIKGNDKNDNDLDRPNLHCFNEYNDFVLE